MNTQSRVAFFSAVMLLAATSMAGTIEYTGPGTAPNGMSGWEGDDVWYAGVSESNTEGTGGSDGMTAELFGAPSGVTGNSIDFNPTDFVAESEDGGASIVDGQLSFMVLAGSGKVIDNIQFSEAGDTTLAGGTSSDATLSAVSMELFIDVLEVDGAALQAPVNIQASMEFTPSEGDYFLATDSGGGFFYQTAWTGTLLVDMAAELTAEGVDFDFGATKVNVTLDNTLTAVSIDGTSSFIKKKDFDGLVVTTNIPEPAAAVLLALASAFGFARRNG